MKIGLLTRIFEVLELLRKENQRLQKEVAILKLNSKLNPLIEQALKEL